eukprot:CAMPEP_0179142938 /NCGR_PEP_ID=MMETSP0796-20121207/68697_1 /TAXON_ID=73915 /ORGANISM="Pyrodinium bahamense, Strain pbaha01" /LENGTH=155 /DNA_ID=CAMNT_0020842883 /DNA_START=41 /DNA_END=508 /DNA_ORIENTATION=-
MLRALCIVPLVVVASAASCSEDAEIARTITPMNGTCMTYCVRGVGPVTSETTCRQACEACHIGNLDSKLCEFQTAGWSMANIGGTSGAEDAQFTDHGIDQVACGCVSRGKKSNFDFVICDDKEPGKAVPFVSDAQTYSKPLVACLGMASALPFLQ